MPESSKPDSEIQESKPKSTESNFFEDAGKWIKDAQKLVNIVTYNLRYGSWTKRLIIVGGLSFFLLNPKSAKENAKYIGVEELPSWYPTLFITGMSGIGVGTVAIAVATYPKPKVKSFRSSGAIKGLQSFDLKDAHIFSKLGRTQEINKYWTSIQDEEFRFGILTGESGCGKSSLLQAGLLPQFMDDKAPYFAIYIKLRSQNVIDDIQKALEKTLPEPRRGKNWETIDTLVGLLEQAVELSGKPVILIIDQFEQFFSRNEQTEVKKSFILDLKDWYESELDAKILIGIRSDWHGRLEEVREELNYTSHVGNSFLLKKFSPYQATEVLEEIATREHIKFDRKFIKEVMECQLAKVGEISPVDVQLLALTISEQSDSELRQFTPKAFDQCGGVEGLLARFLDQALATQSNPNLKEVSKEVLLALTNLEEEVREKALSLKDLQRKMPYRDLKIISEAVQWLSHGKMRLVTAIEGLNNEMVYELAHERLIRAIKQIAGQEISVASKANRLLDERVNKWLKNGKDKKFLLNMKELFLLWKQRNYLIWNSTERQKKELIQQSKYKVYHRLGILSTPIFALVVFWGWSNTEPGQIQWIRWQIMTSDYIEMSDKKISTAIALDLITTPRPFSEWRYFGSSFNFKYQASKSVADFISLANDRKDPRLSEKSISATESFDYYIKVESLKLTYKKLVGWSEVDKANQILKILFNSSWINNEENKVFAIDNLLKANNPEQSKKILEELLSKTDKISDEGEKYESYRLLTKAYITLGEQEKAKEIINHRQGNPYLEKVANIFKSQERSKPIQLIEMVKIYMMLNEVDKSNQILSEVLDIIKESRQKANNDVFYLDDFLELYIKLNDVGRIEKLLREEVTIMESLDNFTLEKIIRISNQLGDREKSEKILNLMLEIYPKNNISTSNVLKILDGLSQTSTTVKLLDKHLNNLLSKRKFESSDEKNRSLFLILGHAIKLPESEVQKKIVEQIAANLPEKVIKSYFNSVSSKDILEKKLSIEEIKRSIRFISYFNTKKSLRLNMPHILMEYVKVCISLNKYNEAQDVFKQVLSGLRLADSYDTQMDSSHTRISNLVDILESSLKLKSYDKNVVRKIMGDALEALILDKDNQLDEKYKQRRNGRIIKLIEINYQLKDYENVEKVFEKLIQKPDLSEGDRMNFVLKMIKINYQLKNYENSEKIFEKFIQKSDLTEGGKMSFLLENANLTIKLGANQKSEEKLEKLLLMIQRSSDEESQYKFLTQLVKSYTKISNVHDLKQILEQSLKIVKSFSHESSGDKYRKARLQSARAELLLIIAQAYYQLQDTQQAKNLLEEVRDIADKEKTISLSSNLAILYAKLGNLTEAMKRSQLLRGNDQLIALAEILRIYTEKHNPEFRQLTTTESNHELKNDENFDDLQLN